jgi:RND family efflux transporter MFP subunit
MKTPPASYVFVLVTALLTISCSPPKTVAPPLPKVTVQLPQRDQVTSWDEYPGHLEAVEMVEVRPRVSGYIDSIHFQEGTEVKAGELLLVIDPRPYQAELEHAQAQQRQAQSHLELVQNEFRRADGLRGTKAISEEEWDSRRNAVHEAESTLAAAKAKETTARIDVEYTHIKSPISGRVGRRLVTQGNVVQGAGMMPGTVVATIVSLDPIYCSFDADEQAYLRYRKNDNASPSMTCELALVNEEGFPHRGKIDFFDNQVDPKTGTIRMRAVFDNADRALVPGLFARVRIPLGKPEDGLLVPEVAVGSDQGRKFVLIVNSTNVIETRPIQTGRQYGSRRMVLTGLKSTDRVVINGLMLARPGAKVDVVEAASEPASPRSESAAPKTTADARDVSR